MKKYIIKDEYSSGLTETSFHMRQNAWQHLNNSIDIIKNIKKIHIPWAHTKHQVDMYIKNKEKFLKYCKHYSRNALKLKNNDKGIIEGEGRGIIVQICSDIKVGIIEELIIIRKERLCDHQYTCESHDIGDLKGCNICADSIVSICHSNDSIAIQNAIKNGYIIEPFYAPYFHVNILGEIDYEKRDKRTVVIRDSFCAKTNYFKEEEITNPFDLFA